MNDSRIRHVVRCWIALSSPTLPVLNRLFSFAVATLNNRFRIQRSDIYKPSLLPWGKVDGDKVILSIGPGERKQSSPSAGHALHLQA